MRVLGAGYNCVPEMIPEDGPAGQKKTAVGHVCHFAIVGRECRRRWYGQLLCLRFISLFFCLLFLNSCIFRVLVLLYEVW